NTLIINISISSIYRDRLRLKNLYKRTHREPKKINYIYNIDIRKEYCFRFGETIFPYNKLYLLSISFNLHNIRSNTRLPYGTKTNLDLLLITGLSLIVNDNIFSKRKIYHKVISISAVNTYIYVNSVN
ncbi:hypothetical protein CDIK_4287, partial [Cucumispora dikerogammari]